MAQKPNLCCVIRSYKPTDKPVIVSLLRFGILEHVYPAFFRAMRHTDHIGVTLSVSVAGYVLGGRSYLQALLFGGVWVSLIYYCCYEVYDSFLKARLDVETADVQATFLDDPVNHFWVAEMELNGRSKVAGLLAVKDGISSDDCDLWNANRAAAGSPGGSAGSILQLIVSFPQRRRGLGTQLVETAVQFCKDQGLPRIVVEISSPQTAAISLFRKLGFTVTGTHSNTRLNLWISKLAMINVIRMEKYL